MSGYAGLEWVMESLTGVLVKKSFNLNHLNFYHLPYFFDNYNVAVLLQVLSSK